MSNYNALALLRIYYRQAGLQPDYGPFARVGKSSVEAYGSCYIYTHILPTF